MGKRFGMELVLDMQGCELPQVTSPDNLAFYVDELVELTDTVPHGPCTIDQFGKGDPVMAGSTMIQLTDSVSITGRFVDASGDGYLNVFSRKDFDADAVLEHALRFFRPREWAKRVLPRGEWQS